MILLPADCAVAIISYCIQVYLKAQTLKLKTGPNVKKGSNFSVVFLLVQTPGTHQNYFPIFLSIFVFSSSYNLPNFIIFAASIFNCNLI